MARRHEGSGRFTPPGSEPYHDPLRPQRPGWVRGVVLVMVAALLLSVVAAFFSAIAS
jgi:hypothetical protein